MYFGVIFRCNVGSLRECFCALDMIIRLKELGERELADRLSLIVDTEKAEQVEEALLSDPFKDSVHQVGPD